MKFIGVLLVLLSFEAFGMTFVDRGDGTLEVSGAINDSDYARFKDATANGKVRTVVFKNSRGGDVQTGNLIAGLLQSLKVETVVEGFCRSQCAITFLAGHKRRMNEGAYLGFHSAYRYDGMGMWWPGVIAQRQIFKEAAGDKYDDGLMELAGNLPRNQFLVVKANAPTVLCVFDKEYKPETCVAFKDKNAYDLGVLN